jgi:hypothetical protein
MANEDALYNLWNTTRNDFEIGDFDSFKSKMQDPTLRSNFYKTAGAKYDLGDYGSFEIKVAGQPKPNTLQKLPSNMNPQQVKSFFSRAGKSLTDTQAGDIAGMVSGKSYEEAMSLTSNYLAPKVTAPVQQQAPLVAAPRPGTGFTGEVEGVQINTTQNQEPDLTFNTIGAEIARPKSPEEINLNISQTMIDEYKAADKDLEWIFDAIDNGKIPGAEISAVGNYLGQAPLENKILGLTGAEIAQLSLPEKEQLKIAVRRNHSAKGTVDFISNYATIKSLQEESTKNMFNLTTEVTQMLGDPQADKALLKKKQDELYDQIIINRVSNEVQEPFQKKQHKKDVQTASDLLDSMPAAYRAAVFLESNVEDLYGMALSLANSVAESMTSGSGAFTFDDPEYNEKLKNNPDPIAVAAKQFVVNRKKELEDYKKLNPITALASEVSILDGLNAANGGHAVGQLVASMGTVLAATYSGGPVAGFMAGYGMMYGDLKDDARLVGFEEDEAEIFAKTVAIGSGFLEYLPIQGLLKGWEREMLKTSTLQFIRSQTKAGVPKTEIINSLFKRTYESAQKALIKGLPEGGTEVLQNTQEQVTKVAFNEFVKDKEDPGFEIPTMAEFGKQTAENFVLGMFGTGGISVAGDVISGTQTYGKIASAAIRDNETFNNLNLVADGLLTSGKITQQQRDSFVENLKIAKEAKAAIPKYIKDDAVRQRSIELILDKKRIEADMSTADPSMLDGYRDRLISIQAELKSIADQKWTAPANPVLFESVSGLEAMTKALVSNSSKQNAAGTFVSTVQSGKGFISNLVSSLENSEPIPKNKVERTINALETLANSFSSAPVKTELTEKAAQQAQEIADQLKSYSYIEEAVEEKIIPGLDISLVADRIALGVPIADLDFMGDVPADIQETYQGIVNGDEVSSDDANNVQEVLYSKYKELSDVKQRIQDKLENTPSKEKQQKLNESIEAISEIQANLAEDITMLDRYKKETRINEEATGLKPESRTKPVVKQERQQKQTQQGQKAEVLSEQELADMEYDYSNPSEAVTSMIDEQPDASKIYKLLNGAIKFINKIAPNVKIYVHATSQEFYDVLDSTTGSKNQRLGDDGMYVGGTDGKPESVHFNLEAMLGKKDPKKRAEALRTFAHEAMHVGLQGIFGNDQKLFQSFQDKLGKILNSADLASLNEFVSLYEGEAYTAEEFLAELTAMMSAEGRNIPKPILARIAQLINNTIVSAARKLGITVDSNLLFKDTMDTNDVIDFFNTMAESARTGIVQGVQGKAKPLLKQQTKNIVANNQQDTEQRARRTSEKEESKNINTIFEESTVKKNETARRIKEQQEIDGRPDRRVEDLPKLLESYVSRSSGTRGIDKRDVRGTKRLGGLTVNTIAEYTLDNKIDEGIKKAFPDFMGVQKVYEITDGVAYKKLMINSLKDNKFAAAVTIHTPEEFNDMRMFVTEDGSTGVTITKDGFLGGAFSSPTRPKNVSQLLILGIKEGASTAECFDTILPNYYADFGFKAVSRTAFNDEYKPMVENGNTTKDWDYETFKKFNNGRPDVVFIIYDGGNRNTIEDRIGQFQVYTTVNTNKEIVEVEKANTKSFDKDGYDSAEEVMKQQAVKRLEYDIENDVNKTTTTRARRSEGAKPVSNSVKDIDVNQIRTLNRPGAKISKGLSVKTVNKKKVVEEAEDLSIDYVKEKAPEIYISNANILANYPIVAAELKPKAIKTIEDAEKVYDIFIRRTADNLNFLINNFDKTFREISTLWYDGANILAQNLSSEYGISKEQVSGMIASLSPQKDWYQNVRLAEMVMMAFKENPVMTQEMVDKQKLVIFEGLKKSRASVKSAEKKLKESRTIANKKLVAAETKKLDAKIKKTDAVVAKLQSLVGKKMNQVSNGFKPYYARLWNEINTTKDYDVLRPDGEVVGVAKKKDGTNAKVAWGSYTEIGKATAIYMDGSQENITKTLGEMHKIRNFYNNIIDPMSLDNDVTMDTHAVAASLLMALSGKSKQVNQNFGTGTSNSSGLGIKGLYYAFAEGYKLSAKENKLLPRQVQSITWEAVRGLYTDSFKNNTANVAAINKIWKQYEDGEITIDQARANAVEFAGGIKSPTWAGSIQTGTGGDLGTGDITGGDGRTGSDTVGGSDGGRGGVTRARRTQAEDQVEVTAKELDTLLNTFIQSQGGYAKEDRLSANAKRAETQKANYATKKLESLLGFDIGNLPSLTEEQKTIKNNLYNLNRLIGEGRMSKYDSVKELVDDYKQSKSDGTNPELVQAVEQSLPNQGTTTRARKTQVSKALEAYPELATTKVVNEDGTPKILYHGGLDFKGFRKGETKGDAGIYFTDNPDFALYFAHQAELYERDKRNDDYSDVPERLLETGDPFPEKYFKYAKVQKVYLDMKDPKVVDAIDARAIPNAYGKNNDGFIAKTTGDFGYKGGQYVVFEPSQIKDADPKVIDSIIESETTTRARRTQSSQQYYNTARATDQGTKADRDNQVKIYDKAKAFLDNFYASGGIKDDEHEALYIGLSDDGIDLNPNDLFQLRFDIKEGNRPKFAENKGGQGYAQQEGTKTKKSRVLERIKTKLEKLATNKGLNRKIVNKLKESLHYTVQNQDDAMRIAQMVVDEFGGIDGPQDVQDLYDLSNEFSGAVKTFIVGNVLNEAYKQAKKVAKGSAEQLRYQEIINSSSSLLAERARDNGREIAALYKLYLNSPEGMYTIEAKKYLQEVEAAFGSKSQKDRIDKLLKNLKDAKDEAARLATEVASVKAAIAAATGGPTTTPSAPKPSTPKPPKPQTTPTTPTQANLKKERTLFQQLKDKLKSLGNTRSRRQYPTGVDPDVVDILSELARVNFERGIFEFYDIKTAIAKKLAKDNLTISDAHYTEMWQDIWREANNAQIAFNAEILAKRIIFKADQTAQSSAPMTDPIKLIKDELFRRATQDFKDLPDLKESEYNKLRTLLIRLSSLAKPIWNESKDAVERQIEALDPTKYTDAAKAELRRKLDNFFNDTIANSLPRSEKKITATFAEDVKDKELKIQDILLMPNETIASNREEFVKDLVDRLVSQTGISYSDAQAITEAFTKEYDKLAQKTAEKILARSIPKNKNKDKILNKSNAEKAFEMIKYGAIDPNASLTDKDGNLTDLNNLFSDIFGLPKMNDEIRGNLKAFAEQIAKTKPNSILRQQFYNDMMSYIEFQKIRDSMGLNIFMSQVYHNVLFSMDTMIKAFNSNIINTPHEFVTQALRAFVEGDFSLIPLLAKSYFGRKGDKTSEVWFREGFNNAKLTLAGMVETENFNTSNTAEVLSKYSDSPSLRAWGKYARKSNRFLGSIDTLFTSAATGARISDLLYDEIKYLAKQNNVKLSSREIADTVANIQGVKFTPGIANSPVKDAIAQATDEFVEAYGQDVDINSKKNIALFRARVMEIVREGARQRAADYIVRNGWASELDGARIDEIISTAKDLASKVGLVGNPPGTFGVLAHILMIPAKAMPGSQVIVGNMFAKAPMNAAEKILQGNTLIGGIVLGIRLLKNQRGVLNSKEAVSQFYDKEGIRSEMYGRITSTVLGREVNMEKKEMIVRYVMLQAAVLPISYFSTIAIAGAIAKAMDDDDERKEDLIKNDIAAIGKISEKERQMLFFGDKTAEAGTKEYNGQWKNLKLYVTGPMYGYTDRGAYSKMSALKSMYGIEPYSVYCYGKLVTRYNDNPILAAVFGGIGANNDVVLFNNDPEKPTETYTQMMMQSSFLQLNLVKDQAAIKPVMEFADALGGTGAYSAPDLDNISERAKLLAEKKFANLISNITLPAEAKNFNQDIKSFMGVAADDPREFYEFLVFRAPIADSIIRNDKTDAFGFPIEEKTKRVLPVGTQGLIYAKGPDGVFQFPQVDQIMNGPGGKYYALFMKYDNDRFDKPGISSYIERDPDNSGNSRVKQLTKPQLDLVRDEYKKMMRDFADANFEEFRSGMTKMEFDLQLDLYLSFYNENIDGYKDYILKKVVGENAFVDEPLEESINEGIDEQFRTRE